MLILSRKREESIILDLDSLIQKILEFAGRPDELEDFKKKFTVESFNVDVKLVAIGDGKIRLGIEAPTQLPVHREEVYDAIRREKEAQKVNN